FPGSWAPFAGIREQYSMSYVTPISANQYTVTGSVSHTDLYAAFQSNMLPGISPVTSPQINGLSLFSNRTSVYTITVISCSVPITWTPHYSEVWVNRLDPSTTQVSTVLKLRAPASVTSLRVPPGFLSAGVYYVIQIRAINAPNDHGFLPAD